MRKENTGFVLLLIVCLMCCPLFSKDSKDGFYLGSKTPGKTPIVFAPGIISTDNYEFAGTFSNDLKTYVFTRRPTEKGSANRIFEVSYSKGKWTSPVMAPFARDLFEFEPSFSPDGKLLYFSSDRSKPSGATGMGSIWRVDRKDGTWGEPMYITDNQINKSFSMYVTISNKGNLYYTGRVGRKFGICKISKTVKGYGEPEFLSNEINSLAGAAHPFISPDEKYLLFDSQESGRGKPEIYISFNVSNKWTKAVKFNQKINATKKEFAASVSPDGKYMFFCRKGDIYWVSSKVIDDLKPEELK